MKNTNYEIIEKSSLIKIVKCFLTLFPLMTIMPF